MARFTLWDCSKAAAGSLAALLLSAGLAWGEARWSQGVFPVAVFSGFTSHFGPRIGPFGGREPHHGIDIAAPLGSPIRNWWSGVVQQVINDGHCGLGLVIQSGPYEHVYCHLSGSVQGGVYRSGSVSLQAGNRLASGTLIGHVGVSGRSTGPHLHWGVRYGGRWLNPAVILRAMAAPQRQGRSLPTPNPRARP